MPYLSRTDIERIAEPVIAQYKRSFVPEKHLCYNVDPVALASMLGLRIDYQYLSEKGKILGMTSADEVCVTVLDSQRKEVMYFLDGNTILVDRRLRESGKLVGRMNFTTSHEIAHQIIYRLYPELYGPDCRVFCDYRRSERPRKKINDWEEWQADSLAAALLLPLDAIQDAMFIHGLGEKMKVLSRKYSENNYIRFCEMAEFLGASKSALAFRMEQFGLLERNELIAEAKAMRGVA